MKHCLLLSAIVAVIAGCAPPSQAEVVELWRLDGLADPESVVPSADGAFVYVSNVNGGEAARDGNGFISRISLDGQMLEQRWAQGLNAPKGLAHGADNLYVADIDEIAVVRLSDGAVQRRVPMPGARFLNDAVVTPAGEVLAADSMTARIFVMRDGVGEVWLEDALLGGINGLLSEPERLIVSTMQGRLLAVDYRTKTITVLAEGLGAADGVGALGAGRYLVSEWPGVLHIVAPDGSHRTVLDTRGERRFLNDFALVGDLLVAPNWEPGSLTVYRIELDRTN